MKKLLSFFLCAFLTTSMIGCGSTSEDTEKETTNEETTSESADVVIIGSGAAGISAALTLAEKGISCIVLEKQGITGGASLMASTGINAGSSDLQNETETPYTAEQFLEYAKSWDYGYDRIGYRVVPVREDYAETFANKSAEIVNELVEYGMQLKATSESHSIQLENKDQGGFGAVLMTTLNEQVEKYGDLINVRSNAKATAINTSDEGVVNGVVVETKDGEYTIETSNVILATGGYSSANSEFWQTYAPEWDGIPSRGAAGATGDGITMTSNLDVQLIGMDAVTCTAIAYGEANTSGATDLSSALKNGAILVNKDGQRFINELSKTEPMMEAMKLQPNMSAYLIANDEVLAQNNELNTLVENGKAVEADTLEELAEKLGISSEGLVETGSNYAESAKNSLDEFEKDTFVTDLSTGKYYGIVVSPAKRITTGGIVTDGEGHVLNNSDEVITGLYAAGETTAYGAHPLSASLIFGKVCAETIAEGLNK